MIHKKKALTHGAYIVVPAIAMAGNIAVAQTALPEVELPPVTVSAHNGVELPYNSTGVSVSVLDVEELKKEGIYSLSEALTTVPGVSVLPGGGENQRGNTSKISIRGINQDTAVLPIIDGMRIFNSAGGGLLTANTAGRTDLFSIGTLEVLKGSQGALYGGGAMGGVLYMETPKGDAEKPMASIFNEVGSHNSYTGNFTTQGQQDALAWFLSSTYTRTDNELSFADGSRPTHRNAGEYEGWSEALRLDWQINPDHELTFTFRREDSEYGYVSSFMGEHYYTPYTFRNNLLTLKWKARLTEQWSSSLMAGYFGYDATLGTGYTQELRNIQLEWRNSFTWNPIHTTSFGLAWNRSAYDYLDGFTTSNGDHNRESTGAIFAEHTYTPIENWKNSIAARLELSNIYHASLALRAATSYRFNNEATRLFASIGSGYRSPGSFQRSKGVFTSGQTTYHGNPDLQQEKSISLDFGVEHDIADGHTLSLTAFRETIDDGIRTKSQDYTDIYYINDTGHWSIIGLELALQGTFEQSWNTGYKLSWTITRPKNSDGKQIPWTSRNSWNAELYTSPIEGLTTGIGLTAASGRSNYEGAFNQRVDNYYSLRWFAKYAISENISLHLRVENLTNQKFETEGGFGAAGDSAISAGTTVYGGFTITF